jgi:hypothetical protein
LQVGAVKVPALYPFHVWGDVVGDLPEVDNYAEVRDTPDDAVALLQLRPFTLYDQ